MSDSLKAGEAMKANSTLYNLDENEGYDWVSDVTRTWLFVYLPLNFFVSNYATIWWKGMKIAMGEKLDFCKYTHTHESGRETNTTV